MYIFRALDHRNYRLHFIGQTISLLGTWMQRIAVSWLVYRLTDSAFLLGLVVFISLIPSLILSPFIGSYVDKHEKYNVLVLTQIGLMIQAGVLALMVWSGHYTVVWIAVLSFIQGVINAFDVTARQSLMVDLVEEKADLANAIALNSSAFNAARLVGPAIGGILLATYGEVACFMANFLSFFAVIGTLLMIRLKPSKRTISKQSNWEGLMDGFRYLRRSSHLSSLIILLTMSSLLVIPFTTLLPVVAREMFAGDATTFSWFESVTGLGAMLGAVYMARLKGGINMRFRVIAAATVFGLGLLVLSQAQSIPLALICTMMAATGMMIQNSSINTYIQTHAMTAYRARAISYYIMAFQGIYPIGSLLIGASVQAIGIRTTLLLQGVAGLIIAFCFLVYIRSHIRRKFVPAMGDAASAKS